MAIIYLVRHGETQSDQGGSRIIQGYSDIDLTDEGRRQAIATGDFLAKASRPFHAMYSSDIHRAWQTAELISSRGGTGLECPIRCQGLREWNPGVWTGRPAQEYEDYREQYMLDLGSEVFYKPPGGESMAETQHRLIRQMTRLFADHPDETVLCVSHQTAIDCLVRDILGIPMALTCSYQVDNGSITIIEGSISLKVKLITLNSTLHLD